MAQLSLVLSLFSGIALGGLGLCFALLQQHAFNPTGRYAVSFLAAFGALFIASLTSIAASVTRLLDFRLTAQKVRRGEVEEPLTVFGANSSGYGKATWRLFWFTLVLLSFAVLLLAIVLAHVYLGDLFNAAGL